MHQRKLGRHWLLTVVLGGALAACGGEDVSEAGSGGTDTDTDGAGSDATGSDGPGSTSGAEDSTTASETTSGDADASTTGAEPPPDPVCSDEVEQYADEPEVPEHYAWLTYPPRMASTDTFYSYQVRTNIGDCSTDKVLWRLDEAPDGARLELSDNVWIEAGDTFIWDEGGDPREAAALTWDLAGVEPGCYAFELSWKAYRDCGLFDSGEWAPSLTQTFELTVLRNAWYSGDMHVHTRHSERGPEAGAAIDYYERMINVATDDLGQTFESRRHDSMRGRLHWLVFSDHTNNELEECGRHFSPLCDEGLGNDAATGREIVRQLTEDDPSTLLVVGSEISNKFDGHFGFLPKNPYPDHPIYAPGYADEPTAYDHDAGYGPGIFRERWVDEAATNSEQIDLIHDMGGLAIVNHEAAVAFWVEYDWSSLDFDGLEVWNGGNRHDQEDASAYNGSLDLEDVVEHRRLTTEIPEEPIERSYIGMLKTGKWPLSLVGGSDVHDYNEVVCGSFPCDPLNAELAWPTTTVWAPSFVWTDGQDGVLDGIEAGRVVVHDRSNFIDLRVRQADTTHMVGDTITDYVPGSLLALQTFGRLSDYIDGDNRVLLILGTSGDLDDPVVDVLYNSADMDHFAPAEPAPADGKLRPDGNFDRRWAITLDHARFGQSGRYFVWAQLVPWYNPVYIDGMGRDMVMTGAIRLLVAEGG